MRYTMKGSKRMVPCFDFRACLSTMLVVSKTAVSVREGGTGNGIDKWKRCERERRQSGEHLGTEYEWGGWSGRLSKMCASVVPPFIGAVRVTPSGLSHISSPNSRSYPRRSAAHDRLRPFRTAENAHSFVIWPICFSILIIITSQAEWTPI
jgi:hypothetical protein